MLFIIAALLSGIIASGIRPWGKLGDLNGDADECDDQYEQVLLRPDVGVYEFDFGKTGTWAYQSFFVDSGLVTFLEIWDCFCSGDDFVVYLNGQKKLEISGNGDEECVDWARDPAYCWSQGNSLWAYGSTYLSNGQYNVTIGVRNSPYGKGTAYLSLTTVCQEGQRVGQCCGMQSSNPTGMCNYRTIVNADKSQFRRSCNRHQHHHHDHGHGDRFCHHNK